MKVGICRYYVSITREIYVAVRKSVKSAQPLRQSGGEESRCSCSTGPAPAGWRNLQNLRATSQIYRKFRAPLTLHCFTRKNWYFTHFTALYTGFCPLSGLHTHVAYRLLMYLGAYRFFGTFRACCSLPVHSLPPPPALGGLPLSDRLSEHSHP